MNKAFPRVLTAAFAAFALALTLSGGLLAPSSVSAQATPMPSPAATMMPSPAATMMPSPAAPATAMPNPALTPAGNPNPSAPAPGTDMLNSNPNGSGWLDKFNRRPGPPATVPANTIRPPAHPANSAACAAMMKVSAKHPTAALRARIRAQCGATIPH